MRTFTLLVSLSLLIGCTATPNPKGGGKDKTEAAQNNGDNGGNSNAEKKNTNSLQAELGAMQPVDPVDFRKLVEYLPPAPAGFKAEKADGINIKGTELSHSHASRKYQKEDQSIEVLIQDTAYNKGVAGAWIAAYDIARSFSIDTPDAYTKSLTLEGNPGYEHFEHQPKNGNLNVLVGKRYLVHVTVRGVDAETMRSVYKSIDVKKLAALK